jgi:hypothetical protein
MNTTTSRRGRHAARAAAIASTAAFIFAAAACGTETGSDGSPAAPAPAQQARNAAHPPMSADAAERQGASERRAAQALQEQYLDHLLSALSAAQERHELKLRRSHMQAPSGHDIPLT